MSNIQEKSIDLCAYHYAEQLEHLIEQNRFDDADAIFKEFVVDGVDPNDGKYQWIFINDLTQ